MLIENKSSSYSEMKSRKRELCASYNQLPTNEKKGNRIFYTFIFCQRSTPTQKNKRVKFPTQKLCNSK